MQDFNPINLILLASIAIVSYMCFSNRQLFQKLLFSPYLVSRQKEYYRFVTSAWVHGDTMHLFINLFVLLSFGEYLTGYLNSQFGGVGNLVYIVFFVVTVIASHLTTFLKNKDNAYYASVGASGGVSGVLFACIIIDPLNWLTLFFVIPIPAIVFGVLYLWYTTYMSKRGRDNINHDAHLFGALTGMFLIIALRPQLIGEFLGAFTDLLN
jgi:membrane associated rhomboid family serine protease